MSMKKTETKDTDKPADNMVGMEPAKNQRLDRLIPLKSWNKYHDWPPVGGMRHIRNKRAKKKAAHIFVKKGGLVLVREKDFWEWAATGDAS